MASLKSSRKAFDMQGGTFPNPNDLLEDVVQFGMAAVKDYREMSGDASIWEIPERWSQTELARQIWKKHGIYIWLELAIPKILGWMNEGQQVPLVLEGERTTGRIDIALFSTAERPEFADFSGIIEIKKVIVNGSECTYDAQRIRAINKLFPICGIVGGLVVGNLSSVSSVMATNLDLPTSSIICSKGVEDADTGFSYGFVAALV